MVQDTGKAPGTGAYRPLNVPQPVTVSENSTGLPGTVIVRSRRQPVISIVDRWRIDDEWWRSGPISRFYFIVVLVSGQRLVIYKDLIGGRWYRQSC